MPGDSPDDLLDRYYPREIELSQRFDSKFATASSDAPLTTAHTFAQEHECYL